MNMHVNHAWVFECGVHACASTKKLEVANRSLQLLLTLIETQPLIACRYHEWSQSGSPAFSRASFSVLWVLWLYIGSHCYLAWMCVLGIWILVFMFLPGKCSNHWSTSLTLHFPILEIPPQLPGGGIHQLPFSTKSKILAENVSGFLHLSI